MPLIIAAWYHVLDARHRDPENIGLSGMTTLHKGEAEM
jgi:hypothetical protein